MVLSKRMPAKKLPVYIAYQSLGAFLAGLAGTSTKSRLTLNARVEMSPETLEAIVRRTIDETKGKSIQKKIVALKCLSPGRPNPTFRFDKVVPVF